MGVRESLVLDHFYISADPADFDELIALKDFLRNTSHSKVVVTDDSWEGIYIGSRTRAYFEILRERRIGGIGICLSPANHLYVDPAKIQAELSDQPWQTGQRVSPEGEIWYDWFATCDYPNTQETFFNAWIMKYYATHVDWSIPIPKPSIDKYQSAHFRLGRENVDKVRSASGWFPGARIFTEDKIQLMITDRDGFPFLVDIELVPGDSRFEFKKLYFKHCDPERLPDGLKKKFGRYSIEVVGEHAVFQLNNG